LKCQAVAEKAAKKYQRMLFSPHLVDLISIVRQLLDTTPEVEINKNKFGVNKIVV